MRNRSISQQSEIQSSTGAQDSASFKFLGEMPEPVFGDDQLRAADTTYFEVSPEALIDVAKHLTFAGTDHRKAIEKAYLLICQAHVVSRNIQSWNSKVRRNHLPEEMHQLMENAECDDSGRPLREPLLVAFFAGRGQGSNPTNASKKFNAWFKQAARLADYSDNFPWSPDSPGWDLDSHKDLVAKGWLRWGYIGNEAYLRLPEATKPKKVISRAPQAGEHPTKLYWTTKDVWWPEAAADVVESAKDEYLTPSRSAFRSPHMASQAMTKFATWFDIESGLTNAKAPQTRPRGKRGGFVSPSDKGAGRGKQGKFGQK